jgi:two-component system, chemotaxis family, sensor kinase CheA
LKVQKKGAEAGKSEEGLLSLKAYHEGGQVHIEIMDDGGGISPTKSAIRLYPRAH